MSSELRLKKLRGSGGFVMASLTDDQQTKGNLGGPDLFLAPIGRIDAERISKYFCNTCEKAYDTTPKIEFDNPNEEVAENLTLVERGKYICTTCGSSIAEYREFKKPDDELEVGFAKPQTFTTEQTLQQPSTTSFSEPSSTVEPPLTMPDFAVPESIPETTESVLQTQSPDSSISSIVGMTVYDENAKKIGIAKQVGVNSVQSIVLVISKDDGSDITLPWNQISKVGEIVLLGNLGTSPTLAPPITIPQTAKCQSCGFANKAGSKFCEECGTML